MGQYREWPDAPDWPGIVRALKGLGYTWDVLGELMGLERTAIYKIATGRTRRVEYSVGIKLLELHRDRVPQAQREVGH